MNQESFEFWQSIINSRLATQEAVIKGLEMRRESIEKNLDKYRQEQFKVNSILEQLNDHATRDN